ncbi:MAG TPA: helix-turn-helix domain-containing protein [Candidatus Faecousia faecavium]|nr:helix-turn-helix domain-containing protein [Candidatus Faecousia faecavium]
MTTQLGAAILPSLIHTCPEEVLSLKEITTTYAQLFQNYPDVVSTMQLCEMLGVSERTVYRLLVSNQIKHFKVGRAYRIPKVNVFAFMESESNG